MEGVLTLNDEFAALPYARFDIPSPTKPAPHQEREQEGPLDPVFEAIKAQGLTFGAFLEQAFESPSRNKPTRSSTHRQMVSKFLGGESSVHADRIAELMYQSHDSAPARIRQAKGGRPASSKHRRDPRKMARHKLQEWAREKVEVEISGEGKKLSDKETGLRISSRNATWDFVNSFSMANIHSSVEEHAPTLFRMLLAASVPPEDRETTAAYDFQQHSPTGRGSNHRIPIFMILVTILMLMNARNLQFTLFQKIVGIWLFANSASPEIFAVLCRIGLSVAYTTTIHSLRQLTKSARAKLHTIAETRRFALIYDNLNRMKRVWDPELGQKDIMDSGTAATLVVLEDCDFEKAFDLQALKDAQAAGRRRELTEQVLYGRIDWEKLDTVMALHCLSFLAAEISRDDVDDFVKLQLQTSSAIHCMRAGRKTEMHPLGTSDHDEGSTGGNRQVLDDLILNQLGLTKEDMDRILTIIGEDCVHGYATYDWVLPLIQLWHLGWSDLERILATHWGNQSDISSFAYMNQRLSRKVKNVKRPDFYPAQALVFDTLQAEVLDCWRELLSTDNLTNYFATNNMPVEELLQMAKTLHRTWMNGAAAQKARESPNRKGTFPNGSAWRQDSSSNTQEPKVHVGDHVLSNTILRMRDSMLHYEFQHAIASGDIGRALNVMAFWTYTFTGSGRSKYSNELLELACNFEYEYSAELQEAILNNWLCNPSGIEGRWYPMDLYQEHNNGQLKGMTSDRYAGFGGSFFQDVVAYNIRAFLETKHSLRRALQLGRKGGVHREKRKAAALRELGTAMRIHELHRFRAGRSHNSVAQDDFAVGSADLRDTTRIKKFIDRTLADRCDLHGNEKEAEIRSSDSRTWSDTTDMAATPGIIRKNLFFPI
ncbi:hypothetical protein K474DRAFT_1771763 [Panus rudis PR-1116 ss-1]|nr:hypothetical protein K474DRAFT_1771763 [Panus rudis PR-1116 ss-1]